MPQAFLIMEVLTALDAEHHFNQRYPKSLAKESHISLTRASDSHAGGHTIERTTEPGRSNGSKRHQIAL